MNNKTPDQIIIAPSILSADFSNLEHDVKKLEESGADWLHVDVMDGHFVPNITFGPKVVDTLKKISDLTLDVHLMIEKPERYLSDFRNAGADYLTVHQETCPHLHRTIQQIKDLGAKAGVSINPGTNVESLKEVIQYVDLVLIMSVNPGFGGQKFITSSLKKIEKVSQLLIANNVNPILEVDGGVDETNVRKVIEAGCNAVVAGTGIFKHPDIAFGVQTLRQVIDS